MSKSNKSLSSKKSIGFNNQSIEDTKKFEEEDEDQSAQAKFKGSKTVAFTGTKNSIQEIADMKDEARKLFVKFEEKTYTEQSLYKKEVDSSIKSMGISINIFRVEIDSLKEAIERLNQVKEVKKEENYDRINKVESDLVTLKVKQSNLDKKVNDFIEKTDRTINENLVLSGLVGDYNKFKDLKSLLEYLLTNTNSVQVNKDKSMLEFQSIKEKMESKLSSFLSKYEQLERSMKSQFYGKIEISEDNLRNLISTLQDKLESFKAETICNINNLNDMANQSKHITDIKSISEHTHKFQSNLNEVNHKLHRLEQKADSKDYGLAINEIEKRIEEILNMINSLNGHKGINYNYHKDTIEHVEDENSNHSAFQISNIKSQISNTNREILTFKNEIESKISSISQVLKDAKIMKDQTKGHAYSLSVSNFSDITNSQSQNIKSRRLNMNNPSVKQTIPTSRAETMERESTIIYKMRQELANDEVIGNSKLTKKILNPAVLENLKHTKMASTRVAFNRPENKNISSFISFNLVSLRK